MTCQHFTYGVDQHCHAMVACNLRQKQLQQGQHLKNGASCGHTPGRKKWAGRLKLVKTVLLRIRTTQTMTETTVLDFKLSNTFEEYRAHMNAPEQQAMFAEMGVKTFFIGVCKDDPKRATVMFQGPEDVLYNIFTNPETKPIVEASGHVYEGTVITRWLA